MEEKVEIFISYAREDELLRQHLEQHLSALQRQGIINIWHDRNIGAGEEWKQDHRCSPQHRQDHSTCLLVQTL